MRARRPARTTLLGLALGLALALPAGCGAVPTQTAPEPAATPSVPTAAGSSTPTPSEPPTASPSETASATPSEQPSERPSEQPSEKPSEKSSEKPSERSEKRARDEPAEKPTKKRAEKRAEKPEGKPAKPTGDRTVYLTFDDGPSQYTGRVLDILARYGAKATFFVLGENVGAGSLVRRAARAGHSVQNHSWNHPDLRTLSTDQLRSQIQRTDAAIRRAGGGRSTCVRPPYGATNAKVRSVLRSLGKQQSLWDIDTLDWERPGADRIYRRVVQDARSGSVVLAHDGGGVRTQTVAALPRILETLKKRGYRFGALCG